MCIHLKRFLFGLLGLVTTTTSYARELTDTVVTTRSSCQKVVQIVEIAVPSAMITYGAISFGDNGIRQLDYNIQNSIARRDAFWNTHVADYLQFAPAAAAFVMKFAGVESKHRLSGMAINYALSNLLMSGAVTITKHATGRERPDGSNNQSFPSGHTATAFVAAEFLHQEFNNQSVWISVGGYAVASFVGVVRIYNNKHWLSDVVAGAGIGILSTKAVYWVYPYLQKLVCKKDKHYQTLIFPTRLDGTPCLALWCNF